MGQGMCMVRQTKEMKTVAIPHRVMFTQSIRRCDSSCSRDMVVVVATDGRYVIGMTDLPAARERIGTSSSLQMAG